MNYNGILDYWFGEIKEGLTTENRAQLWYGSSRATDIHIIEQYADRLKQADSGELDHWKDSPRGRLALIILFDQFSRNIYRKSSQAFAFDHKAQILTLDGIQMAQDRALAAIERSFFYMPLEHAEDVYLQNRCVEKMTEMIKEAPEASRQALASSLSFAEDHRDVIVRFGRFPHRNKVLGRESTAEELSYLQTANRYGQ